MKRPKVFGIGFHKTGTTSLAAALKLMGYRVTGPNDVDNPDIERDVHQLTARLVKRFDAFQDNPWPIVFRELDRDYPGSKFVLTVRPTDKWLASVLQHFGEKSTPMREWIYGIGSPKGHEDVYVARYERHNQEVQEYFRHRPNDLLVFRLTEGDGWPTLCPFLGVPTVKAEFPHLNRRTDRQASHPNARRPLRYRVTNRLSRVIGRTSTA